MAHGVCEGAGTSLQRATTPPCPASVVARQKARGVEVGQKHLLQPAFWHPRRCSVAGHVPRDRSNP